MTNTVVLCMLTLTSHYNVVLHHFMNTVLCGDMRKLPTLSLLQSVPMCAVCMMHNSCAALSIPGSPLHASKSLATTVCVPLLLLSQSLLHGPRASVIDPRFNDYVPFEISVE